MRRTLFWRIYLTLLASLVLAALLIAGLWRLAEDRPFEQWSRVPIRFLDAGLSQEGRRLL